jgi:hypothetical protein
MEKSKQLVEARSYNQGTLVVTEEDVSALQKLRALLKRFIKSQLVEANFKDKNAPDYGQGDYGIIEGTKQMSLLKPGSEKLLNLFKLGCRFRKVDSLVDFDKNIAWFSYKCEVYALNRPDVIIAECDAMISSQEKKYRERNVWVKTKGGGSEQKKEATPIADILNTLVKMVQKRAMVGATIIATSASDFFSQDMLDEIDPKDEAPGEESSKEKESPRDVSPAGEPPLHCGKKMMVSRYPNKDGDRQGKKDWYCVQCKASLPREPQ